MPAGRPRKQANSDLLPRLKRRRSGEHFLYYFLHADGYQEPLGKNLAAAIDGWKLRYSPDSTATPTAFNKVSEAFEKSDHFKSLAAKTQTDYRYCLERLRKVFKSAPLETIPPKAIRTLKKSMGGIKTQFNRMKAVMSTVYWWAIDEEELVECENPCAAVSNYGTKPKKVKVSAAMYYAVYDEGPTVMRDWMDLDVIIGQRVSDVFTLKKANIDGGKLSASHGKTGGIVELPIDGDLELVLRRILTRQREVASMYLVADDAGQPLTYWRLRVMFDEAQAKAKAKWESEGREWVAWQRKDLRTKNATDADTLSEAQERLAHTDSRTTKRHYRLALKAKPGRLPIRSGTAEILDVVPNMDGQQPISA